MNPDECSHVWGKAYYWAATLPRYRRCKICGIEQEATPIEQAMAKQAEAERDLPPSHRITNQKGELMSDYATCIGYDEDDKPIYVLVDEEVHPMFMGEIDGKEIWTKSS